MYACVDWIEYAGLCVCVCARVCVCVSVCVCVHVCGKEKDSCSPNMQGYVCVCVSERERERERECVCVCACVCKRERLVYSEYAGSFSECTRLCRIGLLSPCPSNERTTHCRTLENILNALRYNVYTRVCFILFSECTRLFPEYLGLFMTIVCVSVCVCACVCVCVCVCVSRANFMYRVLSRI